MNQKKEMEKILKEMRKKTCQNQLKAIADRVSMAIVAGRTQMVIEPICDENLKAVIVTYEATIERRKEENHGLMLDVISWDKDLPRTAFNEENYRSNFSIKKVSFDEFKKLVEMKKEFMIKA